MDFTCKQLQQSGELDSQLNGTLNAHVVDRSVRDKIAEKDFEGDRKNGSINHDKCKTLI